MNIKNLDEAEEALLAYVPLVSQLKAKDTTLERIIPLMQLVGNPQDRLKVIHIAGTSGKTSTAYYMSALLTATGKKVGLTISPHVDSVTERIQINGKPLEEAEFCEALSKFLELVNKVEKPPTYFELLYAFAIWFFDQQKVDYAVVETGMGGLFDATNVVVRSDKVCLITDIGLDHMHILGNTLSAIAKQKIGIVHQHNQVFSYKQPDEVMVVFRDWVTQHKAQLEIVSEEVEDKANKRLANLPDYQWRNWLLANHAYNYLRLRDDLENLTSQELLLTQDKLIPGRMEIKKLHGKTLIMDGAHNLQKMTVFVDSFRQLYPGVKPAILLALKSGKEHKDIIDILSPLAARIIVTTFNTTQDLPVKSLDPNMIVNDLSPKSLAIQSMPDQTAAFKALLLTPEPVIIVTGSFYLLSQLRNNGLIK